MNIKFCASKFFNLKNKFTFPYCLNCQFSLLILGQLSGVLVKRLHESHAWVNPNIVSNSRFLLVHTLEYSGSLLLASRPLTLVCPNCGPLSCEPGMEDLSLFLCP